MSRGGGQVRIIGGKWRGSRLPVAANNADKGGARPTPDRVRETLFNWLQPIIDGARCLDLFAGTGALGLEALSRGAASATCIEADRDISKQLSDNALKLEAEDCEIINIDALRWLQNTPPTRFDVVFLDPPYATDYLQKAVTILTPEWLSTRALVYCEANVPLETLRVPDSLRWFKSATAGRVNYGLLQRF